MALPEAILASLEADRLTALAPVLARLGVECDEDVHFIEASDLLLHMPELTVVQQRRFEAWRVRLRLRLTAPSPAPEPAMELATQGHSEARLNDLRCVGGERLRAGSEVSASAWDTAGLAAAAAKASHALRENYDCLRSLGAEFPDATTLRQVAEGAASGSLGAESPDATILRQMAEARRYVEGPSTSAVGAAYALLMLSNARRMASAIEKHVKAAAVPVRNLVVLHGCRRAGGYDNVAAFRAALEEMFGVAALDGDPDLVSNLYNARSHTFYPGQGLGSRSFKGHKKTSKSMKRAAKSGKGCSDGEEVLEEATPSASSAAAHGTLPRPSSPMRTEVLGAPEDDDDEEGESGSDVTGRFVWLALSEERIVCKTKARSGLQQAPLAKDAEVQGAESEEERER